VKCTHGSTIGPVDEDMVFYLRTRGIDLESARHLLTYAFAADVTGGSRSNPSAGGWRVTWPHRRACRRICGLPI